MPYYRDVFDSLKVKPEDIRTPEDLHAFPLLSREHIQGLPLKTFIAKDVDVSRCKSFTTSGTTGTPLKIYYRRSDWTLLNLGWLRVFLSSGMNPWHRRVAFTGQQNPQQRKSWYEHLRLWRRKDISTWGRHEEWIEEIRRWKPQVLMGYSMTLRVLAEACEKYDIRDIRPRILFSTSGMLDEACRKYLRAIFLSRIIDIYASYEAGCIAWECEKCSGYHVSSDTLVVEVLKNGRPASPGEEGEVVITNLHSYAMPLIRYRQGDIVTVSGRRPACGRGFPLLENIQGRINDCIVLKNGHRISSQPFFFCVQLVPGVRRWQIFQERIDRIKVTIEPNDAFTESSRQLLEDNLRDLVKDQLSIEIALVDSIPISPASKFRQVSSNLRPNLTKGDEYSNFDSHKEPM